MHWRVNRKNLDCRAPWHTMPWQLTGTVGGSALRCITRYAHIVQGWINHAGNVSLQSRTSPWAEKPEATRLSCLDCWENDSRTAVALSCDSLCKQCRRLQAFFTHTSCDLINVLYPCSVTISSLQLPSLLSAYRLPFSAFVLGHTMSDKRRKKHHAPVMSSS